MVHVIFLWNLSEAMLRWFLLKSPFDPTDKQTSSHFLLVWLLIHRCYRELTPVSRWVHHISSGLSWLGWKSLFPVQRSRCLRWLDASVPYLPRMQCQYYRPSGWLSSCLWSRGAAFKGHTILPSIAHRAASLECGDLASGQWPDHRLDGFIILKALFLTKQI